MLLLLAAIALGAPPDVGLLPAGGVDSLAEEQPRLPSRTVSAIGLTLSLAGPPLFYLGAATGCLFDCDPRPTLVLIPVGMAATVVGPPMLALGALRTADRVGASPYFGEVAVALVTSVPLLMGLGAIPSAASLGLIYGSMACWLGAVGAGIGQLEVNRRAPRSPLVVSVAPGPGAATLVVGSLW